jgi:hypothetical protein
MQHLQNTRMLRRRPQQVTFVRSNTKPAWKQQTLLEKEANGLHGTSGSLKSIKHQPERFLHLGIRIETNCPIAPVHQTDGWAHLKLAATCFIELTTAHSRL